MAARTDPRIGCWAVCEKIASRLYEKYSIDFDETVVNRPEYAYTEYFLHEAAHWLTLDTRRNLLDMPTRLSITVGDEIGRFGQHTRDSLEFDALVVEQVAGEELGIWKINNRTDIVRAGTQATLLSRRVVAAELAKRFRSMEGILSENNVLENLGHGLAYWFSKQR